MFRFGEDKAREYGNKIVEMLGGQTVSKRKDKADKPGGLVYESHRIEIGVWDLLEALEGMCYDGRATEVDDSTYLVRKAR